MSACLQCNGTAVTSDDAYGRPCPACKGTGCDQSAPLKPVTDENCTYCGHGKWSCGQMIEIPGKPFTVDCTREKDHTGRHAACSVTQHDITGVKL